MSHLLRRELAVYCRQRGRHDFNCLDKASDSLSRQQCHHAAGASLVASHAAGMACPLGAAAKESGPWDKLSSPPAPPPNHSQPYWLHPSPASELAVEAKLCTIIVRLTPSQTVAKTPLPRCRGGPAPLVCAQASWSPLRAAAWKTILRSHLWLQFLSYCADVQALDRCKYQCLLHGWTQNGISRFGPTTQTLGCCNNVIAAMIQHYSSKL